jgi:UDP-GlcNAc3NAcA epimerase
MKVISIVGARPQFIKAAVVSRAFREYRADVSESILHTGQHYDANMSDLFFEELNIPHPTHHLGIGGGSHGQNTGQMIQGIEAVLMDNKPDWALVYGDTDSTLAGALAAAKLHVPVAHVEAGLRSFNRRMPEEINRVLTDHVADLLFAPTDAAVRNLSLEGLIESRIHNVGDVMLDAALYYRHKARRPEGVNMDHDFVLSTIHRAENTDDAARLANIMLALDEIGKAMPVILPLHPRTRRILQKSQFDTPNITFLAPVGYLQMVWLLEQCQLVVTDSGGLQKEAYFFGKRCVTMRDETEWVELVNAGWNMLAGAEKLKIVSAFHGMVNQRGLPRGSFYGNGDAGRKLVARIHQVC